MHCLKFLRKNRTPDCGCDSAAAAAAATRNLRGPVTKPVQTSCGSAAAAAAKNSSRNPGYGIFPHKIKISINFINLKLLHIENINEKETRFSWFF